MVTVFVFSREGSGIDIFGAVAGQIDVHIPHILHIEEVTCSSAMGITLVLFSLVKVIVNEDA
jgi:hypothetical protein